MHRVNIESIQYGVKLARTIFSSDGGVLLAQGVELKESYIDHLKNHGINEVYLEDDISTDITVRDVVRDETRNEAVVLVKKLMTNYQFSESIDVEEVKKTVNKILDELLGNDDILYNLSEIKSVDDYTFEHSVNVCILSLITGIGLEFDISRLRELGTGAMLHDIGKLCIPKEILKKPSQLTVEEFEEIKKHTILGYELLKKSGKVNLASAYIAFGHHERYDGSGYPLQLKNENIHMYARIAAVADVYDALTSDRVYRKKLKPNEVFEYITSLGVHHFDPRIIESFVKYVTVYPVGTGVLLNTRERGIVVRDNRARPTRPVIRIVYDDRMKKSSPRDVDLSEQTNIFIVDGCEV
ncbi:MAG TPA: HD-GYP domain-containing protein [Clostridia bacterium]|nr:HD-GYP domain-containing protein [Clostridia bacterium]